MDQETNPGESAQDAATLAEPEMKDEAPGDPLRSQQGDSKIVENGGRPAEAVIPEQEEPVKVTEDQKGQLPSSTDLPTKVEEPKMEEKEFTKASSEAKEATATADDAAKEEPSTTAVLQPSLPGNNVSEDKDALELQRRIQEDLARKRQEAALKAEAPPQQLPAPASTATMQAVSASLAQTMPTQFADRQKPAFSPVQPMGRPAGLTDMQPQYGVRPGLNPGLNPVQQPQLQAAMLERQLAARRQAQMAVQQAAQRAAEQANDEGNNAAMQAAERANQPRRAAARAYQSFKNQDDYFSDSPPDSPVDEDRQVKKPGPKPKPAAKPAESKDDSQVSAWEDPPKKQLALKQSDVTTRLMKKWLQLYWPDDGKWWPCQVASVDVRKKTVTLIYETGEEEADLELTELIQKGEVAWLNAADAPKEKDVSSARRGGRPPADWRNDDYDDEPSTSRGRKGGRAAADDDDDYEQEEEEEEAWEPGRKRKAALKSKARYRELSEAESSDSESPPPSDQSSDWHSSDEDDKPRRKPKKKKKKAPPRPPPHAHHHHPQSHAHPRQHPISHGHGHHQLASGSASVYGGGGRNNIFNEDPPSFGTSFGGVGDQGPMRMPQSQVNPNLSRDSLQGKRDWGGGGAAGNPGAGYAGWQNPSSDLGQLLNRQQQMGQLHIPQVSMQGGGLSIGQYNNPNLRGMTGMAQWRGGPSQDWPFRIPGQQGALPQMSQQLGSLPQLSQQLGSLPQMSQQQLGSLPQISQQMALPNMTNMTMQQQLALQAQRQAAMVQHLQQQQQQQQGQPGFQAMQNSQQQAIPRPSPAIMNNATKNMSGILSQGLSAVGKMVEVQQSSGDWAKGTIVGAMDKPGNNGLVMVSTSNGERKQLQQSEEGRTFNIRLT